jgi:hypothetical protein
MSDALEPQALLVSTRVRRLEGGEPPHLDRDLARVRRGYFRPRDLQLDAADQHRLRIMATADARQRGLVFSHASAAALWGCPLLAPDLAYVHATQPGAARRTTAGVRVHRNVIPDEQIVTLPSGLQVTSRAWTAVQLAATGTLPNVLLPLDHLLLGLASEGDAETAAIIERLIGLIPPRMKGGARAVRHLQLADPRSGSAGESLSRGQMVLLGVPMPDLQTRFPRLDVPGDDVVDFDWPELGAFGEFDGAGKYFAQELAGDRTPQQVLWDEKAREDRIRRHRPRGARWGWNDALSRTRLARILAAAGIVPSAKCHRDSSRGR